MGRRNDDPAYPMHEDERSTREREGPRTGAAGQEDGEERSEGSSRAVNRRPDMPATTPSEVRRVERAHESPDARAGNG